MFQTKVVEKVKTHILLFSNIRKTCSLRDNVGKYCRAGRHQMTIWRMRVAYWIPKTTNIHTGYAVLIAYPLQQWLHERASLLRNSTLLVLFLRHFVLALLTGTEQQKRSIIFVQVFRVFGTGKLIRHGGILVTLYTQSPSWWMSSKASKPSHPYFRKRMKITSVLKLLYKVVQI